MGMLKRIGQLALVLVVMVAIGLAI